MLPFVLGAIDHADDALHDFDIEPMIRCNLLGGMGILDVVFEHRVQNFVGRQRVAAVVVRRAVAAGSLLAAG